MVNIYFTLFNCLSVGRASESMVADLKLFILDSWDRSFSSVAWPTGVQLEYLVVWFDEGATQNVESVESS